MTQTITKEQNISERAYEIWQAEGCPHGRALEHWLAAEREFDAEVANIPTYAPSELAKSRNIDILPTSREAPVTTKTHPLKPGTHESSLASVEKKRRLASKVK